MSSVFIAIPSHDHRLHAATVSGCTGVLTANKHSINLVVRGGSFLPMLRDELMLLGFESGADYMLWVDSDIGWEAKDLDTLIDCGEGFVSGCYSLKQVQGGLPVKHVEPMNVSGKHNELLECRWLPGGFLLLRRDVLERLFGAYRHLTYNGKAGQQVALWHALFDSDGYAGEDVSLCRRWRQIGGRCWLNTAVTLKHFGDYCYEVLPDGKTQRGEAQKAQEEPVRITGAAEIPAK